MLGSGGTAPAPCGSPRGTVPETNRRSEERRDERAAGAAGSAGHPQGTLRAAGARGRGRRNGERPKEVVVGRSPGGAPRPRRGFPPPARGWWRPLGPPGPPPVCEAHPPPQGPAPARGAPVASPPGAPRRMSAGRYEPDSRRPGGSAGRCWGPAPPAWGPAPSPPSRCPCPRLPPWPARRGGCGCSGCWGWPSCSTPGRSPSRPSAAWPAPHRARPPSRRRAPGGPPPWTATGCRGSLPCWCCSPWPPSWCCSSCRPGPCSPGWLAMRGAPRPRVRPGAADRATRRLPRRLWPVTGARPGAWAGRLQLLSDYPPVTRRRPGSAGPARSANSESGARRNTRPGSSW